MRTRRVLGRALIVLGLALLLGAAGLFWHNRQESLAAERAVKGIMTVLADRIEKRAAAEQREPDLTDPTMDTVEIDGEAYIGFLTFPTLDLELPVMSQWSYPGLRVSPCRYAGAVLSRDLVVAAHHFPSHFGRLPELSVGDEVIFTDVHGKNYRYTVSDMEVLQPTAVKEMTAGEYDMSLFTCTYDIRARFTVRCTLEGWSEKK